MYSKVNVNRSQSQLGLFVVFFFAIDFALPVLIFVFETEPNHKKVKQFWRLGVLSCQTMMYHNAAVFKAVYMEQSRQCLWNQTEPKTCLQRSCSKAPGHVAMYAEKQIQSGSSFTFSITNKINLRCIRYTNAKSRI